METDFNPTINGVLNLVAEWEPKFLKLKQSTLTEKRNTQNRTIKQIVGHMIDSATNNTHRVIYLQYQSSPFEYPNYATNGNNDRWIAIQDYENENWINIVKLWKYSNIHFTHIIKNVNQNKLQNQWITGEGNNCTLNDMIIDYLKHLELHLNQIEDLLNIKQTKNRT